MFNESCLMDHTTTNVTHFRVNKASSNFHHNKIEQLALKVYQDRWKFNQVICIAKGGLRLGDVFSRLFKVPLAILSVESYHGDSDDIK